jgi:hypothetical protein
MARPARRRGRGDITAFPFLSAVPLPESGRVTTFAVESLVLSAYICG